MQGAGFRVRGTGFRGVWDCWTVGGQGFGGSVRVL